MAQLSIILILCLLKLSEAGTWLSFNQKTGGIETPEVLIPVKGNAVDANPSDVMRMLKDCNEVYTKREARSVPIMTRQERKDFEMCKALLELVARR
uniref:Uncharacterized protein n=1 Tax=Acrobeloides nanus TaxID=290746 RepID=A0A914DJY8_9BILA